MLALKPRHQAIIAAAAEWIPPEKRTVFLERVAVRLRLRGFRFTNADLDDAVRHALQGWCRIRRLKR
jgi:hypothetical protein